MAHFKYYVVWKGYAPGIYDSWEECKQQIDGYQGALYKSYNSKESAIKAFREGYNEQKGVLESIVEVIDERAAANKIYRKDSIAVDASCMGNPGIMEYRGVYIKTGQELFRVGPFQDGTNNIGEFLALVHVLAFLKKKGNDTMPIYSDSVNAMLWVKKKKCNTKLERTGRNDQIFELIQRAEFWLKNNTWKNPVYKWETKIWGEIPADFGRK